VEDLPTLVDCILGMKRGDPPFSARSFYNANGELTVKFDE